MGWHLLRGFAGVAALSLLALSSSSLAQEVDTPAITILQCEAGCGTWTEPKLLSHPTQYPLEQFGYDSEGYVLIRFKITADGQVSDPVVEQLIGSEAFAEASLKSIKGWRYQPATLNGTPVESFNRQVALLYRFSPPEMGARGSVYELLTKAQTLTQDGNFAQSEAALVPLLTREHLNLYEHSLISYFLMIDEAGAKNYAVAREYAEDATIGDGFFLPQKTRAEAFRLRIRIDAVTGQYGDAITSYQTLQKIAQLDADDPDVKLMADVRSILLKPDAIGVAGRIANNGSPTPWRHDLLRRDFSFAKIEGSVDHFELRCDQQQIESALSDKAKWHVPASWSNCVMNVFGAPGSTFQVVEMKD